MDQARPQTTQESKVKETNVQKPPRNYELQTVSCQNALLVRML